MVTFMINLYLSEKTVKKVPGVTTAPPAPGTAPSSALPGQLM